MNINARNPKASKPNGQQQKQKREGEGAFLYDSADSCEDPPAMGWLSSLLDGWWLPVQGWTVFGRCLWLVCLVFVCYCAFWLFDQVEVLF